MRRDVLTMVVLAAALGYPAASQAVEIEVDYSYDENNFFGSAGSTQRQAMNAAADFYSDLLVDDLQRIDPALILTHIVWRQAC